MNILLIKRLFLFITFISFIAMNANSQQPIKNYEKQWKKVEAFSKKGLPKSAIGELKNIYVLAKKEGQDAQVIKAMTYGISLQNETLRQKLIISGQKQAQKFSWEKTIEETIKTYQKVSLKTGKIVII